jgi:hypothetical protein
MKTYIVADANAPLGYRKANVEGFIPENVICEAPGFENIPVIAIDIVDGVAVLNQAKLDAFNAAKAAQAAQQDAKEQAAALAQLRIDALDVANKLSTATTLAQVKTALQEILVDLVALRKR